MKVMTIQNACNTPINKATGTIPNMKDALRNWFQPMQFVRVQKMTVNFQLEECYEIIAFQGIIQPLSPRTLMMKPEGQRAWTWLDLYADSSLILGVDDIVEYQCIKTRIMKKTNYEIYGFVKYELLQDWKQT